jgi:hypothetical protein
MSSAAVDTDPGPDGQADPVEHAVARLREQVAELGIIAFLAVRRAHLHWWQTTFAVTALAGVGIFVVAVRMLAH